jgi:DNA polymerase elongation subunit (family B)
MPVAWQRLWEVKAARQLSEVETPAMVYEKRAGIMAEFGKIVCISAGYFVPENGRTRFRVKAFYGEDENILLREVLAAFNQWQQGRRQAFFCGHNIREFDIPYLCRRMLVNGIAVPSYLDFQTMKPWETNIIDTFQLWKFGDFKNYTSLHLLAACFNIPTPKDDIDGSMVGSVYWEQNDLERIATYCRKDVVTVAQLVLKFKHMPLLEEDNVIVSK